MTVAIVRSIKRKTKGKFNPPLLAGKLLINTNRE
jgi:hypothetical protein